MAIPFGKHNGVIFYSITEKKKIIMHASSTTVGLQKHHGEHCQVDGDN